MNETVNGSPLNELIEDIHSIITSVEQKLNHVLRPPLTPSANSTSVAAGLSTSVVMDSLKHAKTRLSNILNDLDI